MWEPTRLGHGEGRRRRQPGSETIPPAVPPGYWRRHACQRRVDATREIRKGGCVTQLEAREGQARPLGKSERFVVPTKPSNAGGGKGPQFQVNVGSGNSRESGDEPNTSKRQGWGATGDVACQSEECAQLSLLRALRQGVSAGCAVARLRMLSWQRRRSGRGWPDVRGHQSVWRGEVAGRTGGRTPQEDVSSASRPPGLYPEGGWQTQAVGYPNGQRSCRADGCFAGFGADFRGRFAAGAICLPTGTQRAGSRPAGADAAENGAYGGGGRGPERLFRQHPA